MGQEPKKAYLEKIRNRYKAANRKAKSTILDEFCEVCGYNRKYAITLLRRGPKKAYKRKGPKPTYDPNRLLEPLKRIWFASDQACSQRLKAMIPEWLPHYETEYGILAPIDKHHLLSMSRSTIDRLLSPVRATSKRKGLSGTKPGRILKSQIPILNNQWDESQPGFVEADTVAHCGNSLLGDFVWSLALTDILTGWTECRATWNKGSAGVLEQIKEIEACVPFSLKGFDSDNGNEFLNHHLFRYFTERKKPVQVTRSRPYHKNDNAHVEQKNWTHIRQLFGYDRFDKAFLVGHMNSLYANEWSLYQNHFCVNSKLIAKSKVGSKYKRTYDTPKTPYQRILASKDISEGKKDYLRKVHAKLNPFQLKKDIEAKLKDIFMHVNLSNHPKRRV